MFTLSNGSRECNHSGKKFQFFNMLGNQFDFCTCITLMIATTARIIIIGPTKPHITFSPANDNPGRRCEKTLSIIGTGHHNSCLCYTKIIKFLTHDCCWHNEKHNEKIKHCKPSIMSGCFSQHPGQWQWESHKWYWIEHKHCCDVEQQMAHRNLKFD